MKKSAKITLLVAVLVIIAALVVAGVTGGALGNVKCPDCQGEVADCDVCDNQRTVPCPEYCSSDEDCGTCDSERVVSCPICTCETCGGAGEVQGSFWALIPPVIAIGLALITKEVYSSLFIGIVSGALLAANFAPTAALDTAIGSGLIDAVIVALINKAGGSRAFGEWAQKNIKSRVGAQLATFALGVLIFIDDYFNCLTVGSVMRPVTDKHRVSRAKLSYLIDATAAPVCMIAPISSWAAAVSQYAEDGQGLNLFITAIPYNFYSLLTLAFIIAIVLMKFDYGKMKTHEDNAILNGDLYTEGDKAEIREVEPSARGRVFDLIIPIVLLIAVSVFGLVYVGGIFDGASFIDAFANTDATVGLPWGGLFSLIFIVVYMMLRKLVNFKEAMDCVPQGFIAMVPAILILTFATGLKNITTELGAKYFVGDLMSGAAGLANFLPAIIFLVACVCYRNLLGYLRYSYSHRQLHLRWSGAGRASHHRYVRMPCRRGLRRPLLSHLGYHHYVECRRSVQPPQPRFDTDSLRRQRCCDFLRNVHNRRLRTELDNLSSHRYRAYRRLPLRNE